MPELKHYFERSEAWYDFLMNHPEYRTRHIIIKLYNNYMLDGITCHLLLKTLNNTIANKEN